MTSQSATSASPHINEEADKSNDPPACPKCQKYFDTVVEKTVNEFPEKASCEINKEELSSLEQERTMDQFGDEASFEINREELSSVEQSKPSIKSVLKQVAKATRTWATRLYTYIAWKSLILQPESDWFYKERFSQRHMKWTRSDSLHQDVVLMIVLSVKAGTTQKLEKTILEENGCHIHRKFFVTFAFFLSR